MRRRIGAGLGWMVLGISLAPSMIRADSPSADDFFETTIRPLLVARCQSCHGDESPKGHLSLTSRAAILRGGDYGTAAEPGKPEESLLIEAVRYESEPRMPPKGRLNEAEIAALTKWVEMGLPWPESSVGPSPSASRSSRSGGTAVRPPHWAFEPIRDPAPPTIPGDTWSRNEIDRFVLARLRDAGLTPSPEADRRTLIRRVTFDLLGLPPSEAEITTFLADDRPDAYERLVERLLASPRYGEQWARHWLDVARYSDTKGYVYAREEARWVHAWVYRDWVTRALNADMPYDRFVLLQLAADQVSDDPNELAAMGFLTLGRRFLGVTHEIIDDRIDVVTRGTLGLTVACARCHDHKYDPIPTTDYYALYGVFRNTSERLVPITEDGADLDRDDPVAQGLRERLETLTTKLAEARQAAADRVRNRVTDYLLAQFELSKYPEEGFDQILAEDDLIPSFVRRWRAALDRAFEAGDPVFQVWHDLTRGPTDDFVTRAERVCETIRNAPPGAVHLRIARAFAEPPASPREVAERYGTVFRDVIALWEKTLAEAERDGRPRPESLPDPHDEAIRRVLYGAASPCEVPDEPIVNTESYFPTSVCEALWRLQGEVDRWLIQAGAATPHAAILVDRSPTVESRVFLRGNPASPGEVVPRRFLQVLSDPEPTPFREGSGRRELASAIVDPANPLTPRVAVNRVWMHHFGQGLVRTPGDFGTRADPPSHPELLDWLASRFRDEGWSLKALHRRIVTSATYRQATTGPVDPATRSLARKVDPENRRLWRMQPHRLTFEELRDALLTASGELDHRLGGPPTDLFARSDKPRRTLYGLVDRQDFPTLLRAFDVANPDLLIPQRNETTVPQQALFFLNSPFLLDRARALVRRDEITNAAPEERVRRLFRRVYQRDPTESQLAASLALVHNAEAEPRPTLPATVTDWRYGYGRLDEDAKALADFQPLPHFDGNAWQGGPSWPDPTLGWVQLTADGGHAGNDRAHAAVRRWVAPRDAVVRIESTLVHDVDAGDGVRGIVCGSRLGIVQVAEVHNSRVEFRAERLEVRQGDTIDFIVDLRDNLNSDQFLWSPIVTMLSPDATIWNAREDFHGSTTVTLDGWEQLAQVLLMSNEFSFVD